MLHMCNPASVLAFSKRYSVFVWTGKNDSKTLRVDANFFENEKKVTKTHTTFKYSYFLSFESSKVNAASRDLGISPREMSRSLWRYDSSWRYKI